MIADDSALNRCSVRVKRITPQKFSSRADEQIVDIPSIALQGLEQSQTCFENAASQIANPGTAADSVDLSQAAVNLISAKDNFAANIKVMQTADEIQRTAIDMLA